MKRTVAYILTFLLIFTLFTGCGAAGQPASAEASNVTFTDDLGRKVTVKSCQRTAALLASYADVWLLAGGSVCAAPNDAWEDYGFDLPKDVVDLGATKALNLELLLASQPDLVLASTGSTQHLEWKETLEKAGIPVAYFDVSTFDDYLRMLDICTLLTGQPERYTQYGTDQKARIEAVQKRCAEKPAQKVLLLRASAARVRAKNSHGNVMGEMLADLGCTNIADSDKTLLENLSIESILLENPDKIFIVEVGDDPDGLQKTVQKLFTEDPLWQKLDAVRQGRVYFMDKHLYNLKPNARWAEAYEKLEPMLYGEC